MNIAELEAKLPYAHNAAEAESIRARIAERRRHNARRRDQLKARRAAALDG